MQKRPETNRHTSARGLCIYVSNPPPALLSFSSSSFHRSSILYLPHFFSFLALICYFHPHTPLFLLCSPFNLSGETPTERQREDAGTMGETMGGEKKQHFNR